MRGPLRRILERRPLRRRLSRTPDTDEVEPLGDVTAAETRPETLREKLSLFSTKAKKGVNYPGDRKYTLNSMQEQFGLMEPHLGLGNRV